MALIAGPDLPQITASLKHIEPYLLVAAKHDNQDAVVSYWCRLYAANLGVKISVKTEEDLHILHKLVEWFGKARKQFGDIDSITFKKASQAHLEILALNLFQYADKEDRAGNFSENVVQSFYTAQILYDILDLFERLCVKAVQNQKYAQWRAAYIHKCLINGETPVPGSLKEKDSVEASNDNDSVNLLVEQINKAQKLIE